MKKKLISKDMKDLVQHMINQEAVCVVTYNPERYSRITIGSVSIISINGEDPIMSITERYTKEYAELWKNDVGQVLMKELKRKNRKNINNLYELQSDKFKALIKLITDDELAEFKEKGLDHIKLDDNYYTIIKIVTPNRHYSDKIDDYDIDYDVDKLQDDVNDESNEEDNKVSNSYALF